VIWTHVSSIRYKVGSSIVHSLSLPILVMILDLGVRKKEWLRTEMGSSV